MFGITEMSKYGKVDHYIEITSVGLWNVITMAGNKLSTRSRINNPYTAEEVVKPLDEMNDHSIPGELVNYTENYGIHFDIKKVRSNEIQITQTWQAPSQITSPPFKDMSDNFSLRLNFRKDSSGQISELKAKSTQEFANKHRTVKSLDVKF
jgi:hypothetical protein